MFTKNFILKNKIIMRTFCVKFNIIRKQQKKSMLPLFSLVVEFTMEGILKLFKASEITESVAAMMALARQGIRYQCYSLNEDQAEVIDHITGEKINEKYS
jgi:hypothetical protein